jgi:hypothetical protein
MGAEADALNEQYTDEEVEFMESGMYWEDWEEERPRRAAAETRQEMKSLYDKACKALVNSRITCPVCRRAFQKKHYQQKFCTSKGRGNCKDKYWNTINMNRSFRAGGANLW